MYYLHFELIEAINKVQTINLDYVLLYIFYDQIQKKLQKNVISSKLTQFFYLYKYSHKSKKNLENV